MEDLSEQPSLKGDRTHICPLCRRVFNTMKQLQYHTIDRHGSMVSGSGELKKVEIDHDVLKSSQGIHLMARAMNEKKARQSDSQRINLGIEPPPDIFTKSGYTTSPHRSNELEQEKTFACPHCPKSFRMQEALNVHLTLVHVNTESKESKAPQAQSPSTKTFAALVQESSSRKAQNVKLSDAKAPEITTKSTSSESPTPKPLIVDLDASPSYISSSANLKISTETHLSPVGNSFSIFSGYQATELQAGYFFESQVGEFILSQKASDGSVTEQSQPEEIIIRCFEGKTGYLTRYLMPLLSEYRGRLLVIGVCKLLPVRDTALNVVHYYPAIHVAPPLGAIHTLD